MCNTCGKTRREKISCDEVVKVSNKIIVDESRSLMTHELKHLTNPKVISTSFILFSCLSFSLVDFILLMFAYKLRNKEIRRGAKGSKNQIPITQINMGECKRNHERGCVKVIGL